MRKPVLAGLAAALVAATALAYLPALRAGFVWNDNTYVTENPTLVAAHGLRLIWADPHASEQYYPLVFTSFWIERHLWGLRPFGYHLVNVLLQAASALLLWRLLRRLAVPGAWFGAAIFALHPVCVESVAWVTERKNTLSLALTLLAALAYLAWSDRRAAATDRRARRGRGESLPWHRRPGTLWAAALALFALALFAKTTAALLPAVLLVLSWWRNGRVRGAEVRPLVPFFAVGAALAFNTAWLEKTMVRASGAEWSLSLPGHLVLAGRTVAFYAGKFLWPTDLAFIYPRWVIDPAVARQWLPAVAASAVLAAAWALRGKLGRGPLAGALLFGGVLVPAMGFLNVYAMRYSYVADHFAYQAMAVAAACAAGGVATLVGRNAARRRAAATAGVVALAALGTLTFRHAEAFAGAGVLWRDTLAKNPDCFMCHTNYGFLLYREGRVADAVGHLRESLRLEPDNVPALLNLAKIDEDRGRLGEAASELRAATALDPANPTVLVNLGTVCTKAGRYEDAVAAYRDALGHPSPADYLAHNGLGVALIHLGRRAEAIEEFRSALRLKPDYWMAQANLERALAMRAGPS